MIPHLSYTVAGTSWFCNNRIDIWPFAKGQPLRKVRLIGTGGQDIVFSRGK